MGDFSVHIYDDNSATINLNDSVLKSKVRKVERQLRTHGGPGQLKIYKEQPNKYCHDGAGENSLSEYKILGRKREF